MTRLLSAVLIGAIFGVGLALAGMLNPVKVQRYLYRVSPCVKTRASAFCRYVPSARCKTYRPAVGDRLSPIWDWLGPWRIMPGASARRAVILIWRYLTFRRDDVGRACYRQARQTLTISYPAGLHRGPALPASLLNHLCRPPLQNGSSALFASYPLALLAA